MKKNDKDRAFSYDSYLMAIADFEEKDDFLSLLSKAEQFYETLDDSMKKEFTEIFCHVREFMLSSAVSRYNSGFKDGMLRAEIKQKRQNKSD